MNVKNVQRYLARQAARLRHTARQMLRVAPPWSRVAIEVYPHSPWKSATEMAILRAAAESVAAARRLQASPDAYACRVELRNAGARQQRLARPAAVALLPQIRRQPGVLPSLLRFSRGCGGIPR
jgi:hypothetical protein